jgi:hypothetical protein
LTYKNNHSIAYACDLKKQQYIFLKLILNHLKHELLQTFKISVYNLYKARCVSNTKSRLLMLVSEILIHMRVCVCEREREREKEHRTQFILYSAGKIKNINVKADVSHSYFVLERFKVDLLKAVIVWLQAVYCDSGVTS